jgi:mycothiol synthase
LPGVSDNPHPDITIGHDREGTVVETDATGWTTSALVEALSTAIVASATVSVWIDHPPPDLDDAMATIGLAPRRDLYRMERPLPLDESTDITTRSFEVGRDEAAWMEVNNRAFAWHREQSGWTMEMVRERQAEPWFDPDGFRVHEHDGRMVAFCWTKVHHEEDPPAGEVYVIAVDPDFHGTGLGRALTLAGYQHLAAQGITRGILYVDADNTPAVTLYRDIGLEVAVVRRLYTPAD